MDLVRKKDNRTGIILSVCIHLSLLLFVFLSKGCIELQNPPQFTLEEVIVLDFSEKGGGSPGSSSPQQPQPVVKDPAPQEVTQEESPVATPTSSNTQNTTSEETTAEPEPQQNCKPWRISPCGPLDEMPMLRGDEQGDTRGAGSSG